MSGYSAYNPAATQKWDPQYEGTDHDTLSVGMSVAASATVNVKGAYSQLIAATTRRARAMYLTMVPRSGATCNHLIDIAVGPAGSEVVLIGNIPFCHMSGQQNWGCSYTLPLDLPAGTRISARSQSDAASNGIGIYATLYGVSPFSRVFAGQTDLLQTLASSVLSTSVDGGATAATKGAWTQMSAATVNDIYMLSAFHADTNGHSTGNWFTFDIGVGAAGSEVVVVPNFGSTRGGLASNNQMIPATSGPFPVNIPAGSRVSMRCAVLTNTDRACRVALLGSR